MRAQVALLTLPLAVLMLTSCGVDPAAERRELVLGITEAANAGDEDGVRAQAASLLELVERQAADEELAAEEADRLRALVERVRSGADVLDEALQAQQRAAEQARRELEQTQRQLEEERRKAEEAARGGDKGEGKGKNDEKDD